jgi:DNA-binding NarL/FixJ family response regulator
VGKRKRVIHTLTSRQRQVLRLVVKGRSAREIGSLLNISPRTVEYHKYRLIEDLQLPNSTALIRYAIENGLVSG